MKKLKILLTFISILLLVFCMQTALGKNEKEPSSLNKYFSFCIIGNDPNSSDPNMWGATITYDNDSGEILNLSKTEIVARSFEKGFKVVMLLDKNNNLLNSLPSIVPMGTGVFFKVIVTGSDINPPHTSWKSVEPSEKDSVNIAINPNNPAKRCDSQIVTGSISVSSVPAGAQIWINGKNTNKITPFVFSNLLPGSYEVLVKKEGYYDETKTVNLFPGNKITLEFELHEKTGNLEVSSIPAGAEIWLNGQNTGYVTPYTIMGLNEGSYTVVCKLAGYLEKSKSVEIIPSQTASLSFELEKDYKAVTIPAGCFYMGDHIGDGEGDERPIHLVCVSPFQIRQNETTNVEYKECVDSGKCSPPAQFRSYSRPSYYGNPEYNDYPVIYVGWYDAKDYCNSIGMKLPTEAEWEFAARGKLHGMKFPYGNTLDKTQANYDGLDLDTIKVGSLAPNGYGLYDMSGNVWEWVNDWYSSTYYSELPELTYDPQGPDYTEVNKVLRGGSFVDSDWASRVAHRHRDVPTDRPSHRGIRCAKPVTTSTGTIFVTSVPRGAEIYLNGVKIEGLTPNNITGLTPNLYVVECELNGQRSEPKDVSVEADKAVPVVFDFEETEQMVAIPTGSFTMGAVPGDTELESDEVPAHLVYITKPFKMDKYEVTNGEYQKCVAAGNCTQPSNFSSATRTDYYNNPDYSNYPVIYVSWYDAAVYCSWKGKRLPTEAEWEYAARGGYVGLKYSNGNTLSGNDANFLNSGDSEDNDTTQVGIFPPNNLGLYDMAGNIYEWIQDWYEEDYYSTCPNPAYDPQGPPNSTTNWRCLRGGSWAHNPPDLRVSDRGAREPDTKQHNYGFRCAR